MGTVWSFSLNCTVAVPSNPASKTLTGGLAESSKPAEVAVDDGRRRLDFNPCHRGCAALSDDVHFVVAPIAKVEEGVLFLMSFEKLGFTPEQTYTTLEKRMKCGIGICGRCNVGPKYVCVDGPVFSMAELNELPDEL
jgi:hypothetical protein